MLSPSGHTETSQSGIQDLAQLGEKLFFDPNLSFNRAQSCSYLPCANAWLSDPRDNGVQGSASLGADGKALGDRNTPALGYVGFTPDFGRNEQNEIIGGQFWDGRENDLKAQAGGPLLNPIEMAMPNKNAVLERLKENSSYVEAFTRLFDAQILDNAEDAFLPLTTAIEHFEKTDVFSSFDSKYDRYLAGEYSLSKQEDLGMTLFFSQQFSNCNQCHQLRQRPGRQTGNIYRLSLSQHRRSPKRAATQCQRTRTRIPGLRAAAKPAYRY